MATHRMVSSTRLLVRANYTTYVLVKCDISNQGPMGYDKVLVISTTKIVLCCVELAQSWYVDVLGYAGTVKFVK